MATEEYDVFEVEEKPAKAAAKPKAEPKDESQPENMSKEAFAELREAMFRMWNPGPEETR